MYRTRRSGRIAKELPIIILGTDTLGKVFSEQTNTVVLSRHGAGIVSRYKFAPDEILTVRLPGTDKEAEMRLVGQIGGEPGRYTYGLAFVDSSLEFWPMEFPPPEPPERPTEQVEFACTLCSERQKFAQRDIEEDVYNVNGFVLRFCQECGTTTRWKKAESKSVEARVAAHPGSGAPDNSRLGSSASPPGSTPMPAGVAAPTATASATAVLVPSPAAELLVPLADLPRNAAAAKPLIAVPTAPVLAPKPQDPATQALDANGRRINRRRHVRVKVNFSACVRHPAFDDEIVECQNVSKGGLCFQSRRQYSADALIEIAAPFTTGEPPLFTAAKIVRVEPLPGREVFRYGVAYVK